MSAIHILHGLSCLQGAPALEAAQKVKIVVFDKTGTLTQGKPAVTHHQAFASGVPELELMHLAAAAEASSEHPLAQALMAYTHTKVRAAMQPFAVEAAGQPAGSEGAASTLPTAKCLFEHHLVYYVLQ